MASRCGYSERRSATYWGWFVADQIAERMLGKVSCEFCRSLPSNDNLTLAHIASDWDDQACGAATVSANGLFETESDH